MQQNRPSRSEGTFFYKPEDLEGQHRKIARTNMSDKAEPYSHRLSIRQFPDDSDVIKAANWYRHQISFGDVTGCLHMQYLHSKKRMALVGDFNHDLWSWAAAQYQYRGDKWDIMDHSTSWWDFIKADFLHIFRDVTDALRRIHSLGRYHGHLGEGIVVKNCNNHICAFLTNMEDLGTHTLRWQEKDIYHLKGIIQEIVFYPYRKARLLQGLEPITGPTNHEIQDFCLSQLDLWRRSDDLTKRWSLNPAIFWGVRKRIIFLKAVHRLLHRNKQTKELTLIAENYFSNWFLPDSASAELWNVYNERPWLYTTKESQLKFWRNAIEHFEFELEDDEHLIVREVFVHSEVTQVTDCFLGSIKTMNAIFGDTRWHVKRFRSSFLEQMEF